MGTKRDSGVANNAPHPPGTQVTHHAPVQAREARSGAGAVRGKTFPGNVGKKVPANRPKVRKPGEKTYIPGYSEAGGKS